MAMKDWEHPAVKRGKIFWLAQAGFFGLLAVFFVFLGILGQSAESFAYAAVSAVLAVAMGFFAKSQIKKLRHEYRYKDDAGAGTAEKPGAVG